MKPVEPDEPLVEDLITIFPSKTSTGAAVLVLPGGAYEVHSDEEGRDYAVWLAELGYHAFVLKYPLAPHRYPTALVYAHQALEWITSGEHGIVVDETRLGVIGSSAGGHLAAQLACGVSVRNLPELRPAFAILCYPVISFINDAHPRSTSNLLGENPAQRDLEALSVDEQVDGLTPPIFVWTTANDPIVSPAHSLALATALLSRARPFELHIFPEGGHGLGLARDHSVVHQWTTLCQEWLTGLTT